MFTPHTNENRGRYVKRIAFLLLLSWLAARLLRRPGPALKRGMAILAMMITGWKPVPCQHRLWDGHLAHDDHGLEGLP